MTSAMVLAFLTNYWWAVGIVVILAAYFGVRRIANARARQFIVGYLKKAEGSILGASDAAIPALADRIYSALPLRIRLFVPRFVFDTLVGEVYREAKKLVADASTNATK